MIPPVFIAGGIAAVAVAFCVAEGIAVKAAWDSEAAAKHDLATMTSDRDAQLEGLRIAKGALGRQQAEMDAKDKAARASLAQQQDSARTLAVKLAAATDEKNALFSQLQEQIDARPNTVVVSVHAPDGWDPVVVSGMRKLRCVQLSAGNPTAPDCRVPADPGAGRSGLAGDPAGAAYPRPSARQQLDFLAFAWSLREWGASCYDDKRAIANAMPKGSEP